MQLVCLNVVIQSDNTMLVQKIESDVPAAVQNEPGIKDESHMGNLSFRILEKGQISETGFLQGNFFAESDLLRGIAGQGDTLGLEYGLGKSGAIRSPRGAAAPQVGRTFVQFQYVGQVAVCGQFFGFEAVTPYMDEPAVV